MKPKKRNSRLLAIALGGVALIGAALLVTSALRQSISYFQSPSDIMANAPPVGKKINLGGMVEKNSVKRKEGLKISFRVTDFENTILVEYDKVLPDLFREGQGVIAEGNMNEQGVFMASRVLAKHDESYMPPQVARALKLTETE